ncbi:MULTISPECIES: DNA/RNA non-specific endonuclease [unclassified Solibacillus]|uniref:DNA/RNA non-specific endonuclease n=1 Tax=unclassified Solibacillus TaxID=2637870 RepID=UPI0030CDBD0F
MPKGTVRNLNIALPGLYQNGQQPLSNFGLSGQLDGSRKDARNLVTLYQTPVNSTVMRDFESSVRAVVEKGKVVRYQSIPIYESNNLMPKGVTLKARGTNGFSLDVTVINMK